MSSNAAGTDRRVDVDKKPSAAAIRIVSNAVRALIAEDGHLTVDDLTAVTCLDDRVAIGAMDHLAATDVIDVEPLAGTDDPAWTVTRTDRW